MSINLRKYFSAVTVMTAMTAFLDKYTSHLKPHETIKMGQKIF